MNIAVVGSGYVGLVAGACFADSGNRVIGVDSNEAKVEALSRGECIIYEPGLGEILTKNLEAGRLEFTTDLVSAVKQSRVIFLAVGTPPREDGSADLSAALEVARGIGQAMDGYRIIVMKSTVPVGTHRRISDEIASQTGHPFDYVSNPEFLKEGAAIEDFMRPDRVIIGTTTPTAVDTMKELYAPFMRKTEVFLVMDPASAEMTKYAANALLATRISFMNEVSRLCERFGADVELVRRGVGSDRRIGPSFLYAGIGYGGSCFPKDVSALVSMGDSVGRPVRIVKAVQDVNQEQRVYFARRIIDYFDEHCGEATVAVWGLAFKARTDDVRESPAITIINMLREKGIAVRAHDPEAMETAAAHLSSDVKLFEDGYEALDGADALVVCTDWPQFRSPDFETIGEKLKKKVLFDGRNLYDPRAIAQRGFTYYCVGRPTALPI
jgi:UDPglucose 6-dehydrogenase